MSPLWLTGLVILLLVPLLPSLWTGELVGLDERIGDRANTLWLHWYAASVWDGWSPFGVTDVFLYPEGVDLWAELFNVLDAFVAMPFVWLLGWGAHYTWLAAALIAGNLWAAKRWTQLWTEDERVAWVGAFPVVGRVLDVECH